MPPRELPWFVSRGADRAKNLDGRIEFHDSIKSAIDHPDMLIGRDVKPIGVTDAGPLRQKTPVRIKNLDPGVLPIRDVDPVLAVDHHGVRQLELAWLGAVASPLPLASPPLLRRPSTISTFPAGLNFSTILLVSSVVQILSSASMRSEWG